MIETEKLAFAPVGLSTLPWNGRKLLNDGPYDLARQNRA